MTGARLDLDALAPKVVAPSALAREDARALASRLARGVPFAQLVECRSGNADDLVIMDVEVEVPQLRAHDIRPVERIGVWFSATESSDAASPPDVLALRVDFPRDVPHLNLRWFEYPRCLCLFDVSFNELRLSWTPATFVTLVREWLRATAIGELHASDQPLEPLILGVGWIILPNILRQQDAALALISRGEIDEMPVLLAVPPMLAEQADRRFVVALIRATPRTHGVIRHAPTTLAELHALLAPEDDVRARMIERVQHWKDMGNLDSRVAIVVLVPLRRTDNDEPEIDRPWAFLTTKHTVRDVGQSLGLWEITQFGLAGILDPKNSPADGGASVRLLPMNAHFQQRREDAARYNGRAAADDRLFVAVGAGALGSEVLDCAARAAFGRWTIVDGDVLLPHNLARHDLNDSALGLEKARGVKAFMAGVAEDGDVHDAIVADVLAPGDEQSHLEKALASATAVLDMSASVAVARSLARDHRATARRISLFLNPTGTDLVLLAEPADRSITLDAIEMQYYRAVANDSSLAGTLQGAVSRERYGRSCRDVSRQLPDTRIKLFAGLGAEAVQRVVDEGGAQARVWRFNERTFSMTSTEIPINTTEEVSLGDWRLVIDDVLLTKLRALRAAKLPKETGGVLLGAVDVARRIVYAVDTIPSPPDSLEWPTLYIRGASGLRQQVERVHEATAGQLHYVGEWHSHPKGFSPLPSDDDAKVFDWITEALDVDDLPATMLIVSDDRVATFIGTIPREAPTIILIRAAQSEPV